MSWELENPQHMQSAGRNKILSTIFLNSPDPGLLREVFLGFFYAVRVRYGYPLLHNVDTVLQNHSSTKAKLFVNDLPNDWLSHLSRDLYHPIYF